VYLDLARLCLVRGGGGSKLSVLRSGDGGVDLLSVFPPDARRRRTVPPSLARADTHDFTRVSVCATTKERTWDALWAWMAHETQYAILL
jgi:hypothetical protein